MNQWQTGGKLKTGGYRTFLRTPEFAFYGISALGILFFILLSFYYGRPAYVWMVQENQPAIRFTDYFMHLTASMDRHQLYQKVTDPQIGCFPPLAYLMYFFLYRLTPLAFEMVENYEEMELIPGTMQVFTYYLIFSALLFYVGISKTGKRSTRRDLSIFTLLMASAVFSGSGYMMGNSAMLVLAMLVIAFVLKDGPSCLGREAALMLFAICIGIKLYPAIFGLMYLKEKRYRELGRLVFYSLALVFLPFVFFGGIEGLKAWVGNILATMASEGQSDFGRPQYLKGLLFTLLKLLTGREYLMLASVLTWLICAGWAYLAWQSKSSLRTEFFLICILVFFPTNAFRYTLGFFSIPLIARLKSDDIFVKGSGVERVVMALYGLLFSIPVWWIAVDGLEKRYEKYNYTLSSVEICLYLTAWMLILTMIVLEIREKRKSYCQS